MANYGRGLTPQVILTPDEESRTGKRETSILPLPVGRIKSVTIDNGKKLTKGQIIYHHSVSG